MRKELDEALCKKYPGIFKNRRGDMRKTAMCWGFPGDGWYKIIDELCEKLQKIADKHGTEIIATQVKEKYGTLRFYIGGVDTHVFNQVHKLIHKAEKQSAVTCEECGEKGELCGPGWLSTLCEKHMKENDMEPYRKFKDAPNI